MVGLALTILVLLVTITVHSRRTSRVPVIWIELVLEPGFIGELRAYENPELPLVLRSRYVVKQEVGPDGRPCVYLPKGTLYEIKPVFKEVTLVRDTQGRVLYDQADNRKGHLEMPMMSAKGDPSYQAPDGNKYFFFYYTVSPRSPTHAPD